MACVIQKFNRYEILKQQLKRHKKHFHKPIDIIDEPVIDHSATACFFTNNLHLTYRSYCSRAVKGKHQVLHSTTRQCYYCDDYFVLKPIFENHIKRLLVLLVKLLVTLLITLLVLFTNLKIRFFLFRTILNDRFAFYCLF